MSSTIWAITDHVPPEMSESTLDKRVLGGLAQVSRHQFVRVEVRRYSLLEQAAADWLR